MLNITLQLRILRHDILRWLSHICMYLGFMMLLLMHALEKHLSSELFADYYSTINPFMFFRDLFGAMVILGIAIAVYRRFILKVPRVKTNTTDHYAIIILAVIMLSGILLEGAKILSHSRFQEMVNDYGDPDNQEEVSALEAYWVKNYLIVSPSEKGPFKFFYLLPGSSLRMRRPTRAPPRCAGAGCTWPRGRSATGTPS